MREAVRRILTLVLRPSLLGATYLVAQSVHAVLGNVQDDETLGKNKDAITDFITVHYGHVKTEVAVGIVTAAIVVGGLLGALSGSLVWLRDRITARGTPRSLGSKLLLSFVVTVALHGLVLLWAMAEYPQLYAEQWYASGGIYRAVQLTATDFLGPKGVLATAAFLLAAFLVGPPSAWRRYPARALAFFGRFSGRRLVVLGAAGVAVFLAVLAARGPTRARAAESAPSKPGAEGSGPGRMNVLILAADSLRADRIDPKIMPNVSSLASRSTVFDKAYVSLPRTFPSWVTILTGRHAHHHGIRSMFPRWEERTRDFDALPERLAKAGYATGVVSDYAGDIFSRIDLGFGLNDTPAFDFKILVQQTALERVTPLLPFLHSQVGRAFFPVMRELNDAADADLLVADALSGLTRLQDRPFFMTVFFSTAHFPYAAPAPYYRRFTDPNYDGRFKYHRPRGLSTSQAPPDAHDILQIQGLYDGAANAIDDGMQQILDALEERGLADRTIVIVTADHGETLYDHGHGEGHGDHLFGDEGTHVPLIVYDPRRKTPRHEPRIVRDVDIAATVYELTGTPAPSDLDGRSLVPAMDGKPLTPALAYAETELWFTEEIPGLPSEMRLPYPGIARLTEIDPAHNDEVVLQKTVRPLTLVARHRMVRDERWKLVYVPTRSGVRYLLFDTATDPFELTDVAAAHADVVDKMKTELWTWMLRDPEMVERAGYLVPRDLSAGPAGSDGIRLGDLGKAAPEPADPSQASPPQEAVP